MEYKEKLDKILSHYGEEYQKKRLEIELLEFYTAVHKKNMNDIKLELAEKNKEIFEIKDNDDLIYDIHSEIADCCVLICQIESCFFDLAFERAIKQLNENWKDLNKEKVKEIFCKKIDRQIERIEKNV